MSLRRLQSGHTSGDTPSPFVCVCACVCPGGQGHHRSAVVEPARVLQAEGESDDHQRGHLARLRPQDRWGIYLHTLCLLLPGCSQVTRSTQPDWSIFLIGHISSDLLVSGFKRSPDKLSGNHVICDTERSSSDSGKHIYTHIERCSSRRSLCERLTHQDGKAVLRFVMNVCRSLFSVGDCLLKKTCLSRQKTMQNYDFYSSNFF